MARDSTSCFHLCAPLVTLTAVHYLRSCSTLSLFTATIILALPSSKTLKHYHHHYHHYFNIPPTPPSPPLPHKTTYTAITITTVATFLRPIQSYASPIICTTKTPTSPLVPQYTYTTTTTTITFPRAVQAYASPLCTTITTTTTNTTTTSTIILTVYVTPNSLRPHRHARHVTLMAVEAGLGWDGLDWVGLRSVDGSGRIG
ncbi:hypothetical protein E2C01_020502 [Portunus trituberculatus]|uniref:Uncharacterized protein n=1 Tax=Portunus trituberculatus TaxID=210409 RepID=A0A5B7E278_PORTR|nr:hypothetical protein [Portunus trituberculatus]